MSSKLSILALAVGVLAAVGCSGVFVTKDQYDRDVNQQKEYIAALERDNAELRPIKEAYERLKAEGEFVAESNRAYDELAAALKKALEGLGVEAGDAYIDPKTGATVFGTDLLFDSGSFEISVKGKEVLKRFGEANRDKLIKIVGHTDKRPVVRVSTKDKLVTDTNLELSSQRAAVVGKHLMACGIPERHMWTEGRGATQPKNGDKASRRVEIFIVGTNGKTSQK